MLTYHNFILMLLPVFLVLNCAGASLAQQQDVDFGPYMQELQRRIKRSWFPPRGSETKRVKIRFKVDSLGNPSDAQISESSGVQSCDAAALAALAGAAPFRPLPAGAPSSVDIEFSFDYNVMNARRQSKGSPAAQASSNWDRFNPATSPAATTSMASASPPAATFAANANQTTPKLKPQPKNDAPPAPSAKNDGQSSSARTEKELAIRGSKKLYLKGWDMMNYGNFQEAKRLLTLAISIQGTAEKYWARAITYKVLGDKSKSLENYKLAIADYKKAAELYDGSSQEDQAAVCRADASKLDTFIKTHKK